MSAFLEQPTTTFMSHSKGLDCEEDRKSRENIPSYLQVTKITRVAGAWEEQKGRIYFEQDINLEF